MIIYAFLMYEWDMKIDVIGYFFIFIIITNMCIMFIICIIIYMFILFIISIDQLTQSNHRPLKLWPWRFPEAR